MAEMNKVVVIFAGVAIGAIAFFAGTNFSSPKDYSSFKPVNPPAKQESVLEKKSAKSEPNPPEKQEPRDYVSLLEEYNLSLKQSLQLGKENADLSSQLGDLKKQQSQLQQKYSIALEDYAGSVKNLEALGKKQADLSSQYSELEKKAGGLSEKSAALEKEKTSILEKYTLLLEDSREIGANHARPANLQQVDPQDINLLWFELIKKHPNINFVFLSGELKEVDKAKKGFYSSVEDFGALSGGSKNRLATLIDMNGDGIRDIVYDTEGSKGTDKMKEGKADGSFGPAKTITHDSYRETFSREFFRIFEKQ